MIEPLPCNLTLSRTGGDALDAVMEVIEQSFDPRFGEAWTRSQCAGILPMSGVTLILAREGATPVGFSLGRHVVDEAELLLIAVAPPARGKGIALALMQRFVSDALVDGARHLHLEVREGNPAVSLYKQQRFVIVGRRAKYYRGTNGEMFDALTMARSV